MFNQKEKAQAFNLKVYDIFNHYKLNKRIKVAYLIWKKPYMTVGSDTFIHHLLHQLGFDNIFFRTEALSCNSNRGFGRR